MDAFNVSLVELGHIQGRTLTASVQLANNGRPALTVLSVETYPGVTVTTTPRLPLALPYEPLNAHKRVPGTAVTFRLTITSCPAVTGADQPVDANGEPLTTAGMVVFHLRGADGEATTTLQLENSDQELVTTVCP